MAAGPRRGASLLGKAGNPVTPTDLPACDHSGPASLSGHWSFRKGDAAIAFRVEGKLTIRASLGAIAAAVEDWASS